MDPRRGRPRWAHDELPSPEVRRIPNRKGRDVKVRHFTFAMRDGAAPHSCAKIDAGRRRIEITESPTGRSVQVWIDGRRVYPKVSADSEAD